VLVSGHRAKGELEIEGRAPVAVQSRSLAVERTDNDALYNFGADVSSVELP
jgi:hypothetical protein